MVAPLVAHVIVTSWLESYVPPGGFMTGSATPDSEVIEFLLYEFSINGLNNTILHEWNNRRSNEKQKISLLSVITKNTPNEKIIFLSKDHVLNIQVTLWISLWLRVFL
jgi:hypothetical protein